MPLSRTTRVNILIGNGHFLSHFYVLCLPPMFIAWQNAFNVSFAELGLTIALMSGTTAILQTPVGFLVDRHGARSFLIGGALLMSLSIAAMGLATEFWQVLVLATLSGIGNSVFHPADYAILSGSVDKNRMGRSFALHTFSGNLGFSAGAPISAFLMATFGWRSTLLIVGLLGVPVVLSIMLQSRILKDQVRETMAIGAHRLSARDLLTSRTMVLFFLFFMFGAMAGGGVQSCVTGLTILSAVLMLGVDWLNLPIAVIFPMIFASGLALGASRTPRDVMVKDAAPPGQIGKVFGFVSAGLPLGAAVTPVPFGALIDHGHPELVLVLVAAVLLLSLFCGGSARVSARVEEEPLAMPAE
jgi:MFS family permease